MCEYNSFGFDGTIDKYPHEYTKNISFIKSIIVGSNSVEEFKEILKSYYKKKLTKKINYKIFRSNSKFININQW